MTSLLALGGGALVGGSVPAMLSNAVLSTNNTGWVGYLSNLAGTLVLAWGASKVAKGPSGQHFSLGILAGGIGATIKRIIGDYSLLGSYGSQLGMGDYMASNWVTPQRMVDGLHSAMVQIPGGWAPTTIVAPAAGGKNAGMGSTGDLYGGALY